MNDPKSAPTAPDTATAPVLPLDYMTIGIFPDFSDALDAMARLKALDFTDAQLSLLGREQEHWQERLGHEWETFKVTKAAAGGAALGAVPGLVIVTGIALTGGVGLLVAGPMIAAMSALGMGALCGAFMGANSTTLEIADKKISLEEEVADAIGHGHWVVVVHTQTEDAAARARAVMPNRRIVRGEEAAALEPSDAAAEQIDLNKLGKIVDDAFALVSKETSLPALEVMCKVGEIELATLKKATDAAITKISVATDLDTAQITDIFKANRAAGIDVVVNRLREQSLLNRAAW
jgi:hypothetical protein